RAHGVTAERVIGYCAWLLGLQGSPSKTVPQPMSASEALSEFDWAKVRADTTDRRIDQRAFDEYFGL
ncbi:MAG TPA: tRNA glutamyl-Q(34) synthetase GluQRS, partial [Bifidobacterium sp.]|nr:tRNA glutamyl-Q(34) synthetase GluQRS [Bifidobacterium sp.]